MAYVLPFGRHKNEPLDAVPADYLQWVLRTVKLSGGLRAALAGELSRRGVEPPPAPPPRVPRCRCGADEGADSFVCCWQQLRDGRRQVRAECACCRAFLTYLPAVEPYTTMADRDASPRAVRLRR
jgi:hypothetical protein